MQESNQSNKDIILDNDIDVDNKKDLQQRYQSTVKIKAHYLEMDDIQLKKFEEKNFDVNLSLKLLEKEDFQKESSQKVKELGNEVMSVFQNTGRQYSWGFPKFFEDQKEFLDFFTQEGTRFFFIKKVAKPISKIIFIGFILLTEYKKDKNQEVTAMDYFGIYEKFQNKGFGKQVMTMLLKYLQEKKINKITFRTDNLDSQQAFKFYEKFGFQKSGYSEFIENVHYQFNFEN
ncbi:Acyl-CoA N-acyltransferase [Pseudocohnilembus persalinus]|uniref:Acyl-CoA N-acyltransferase n=1 Tax=Pseudocohnilembus persalinus TaxID=266149 RepID=A0A0V0QAE1_PSEPJ|nr:Acyl-CoA N-acyltransferase [Pseudocohnilembus persalinus]|eukprot:KRW99173.1 Acyl-CoA N-acyltransferase [Pseudocohnilembus persalinus]